MYRRYVTLHGLTTSAAFSIAAAWIIVSATRHSSAEAKCIRTFFGSAGSSLSSSEGATLCNIFPWVDIGIMGALWVLLAILQVSHFIRCLFPFLSGPQLYLFVILSSYGSVQRRDHDRYDRIYDSTQPLTAEAIPLDPWDTRPSVDFQGKHTRNTSSISISGHPYTDDHTAMR